MNNGIYVNLFEAKLPGTIQILTKPWDGGSLEEIASRIYPFNVYGDTENQKLFAYGRH